MPREQGEGLEQRVEFLGNAEIKFFWFLDNFPNGSPPETYISKPGEDSLWRFAFSQEGSKHRQGNWFCANAIIPEGNRVLKANFEERFRSYAIKIHAGMGCKGELELDPGPPNEERAPTLN